MEPSFIRYTSSIKYGERVFDVPFRAEIIPSTPDSSDDNRFGERCYEVETYPHQPNTSFFNRPLSEIARIPIDASLENFVDATRERDRPTSSLLDYSQEVMFTPKQSDVNKLRCIVAIPIVPSQDGRHLVRLADLFASQTLPPDEFEIVVFGNETMQLQSAMDQTNDVIDTNEHAARHVYTEQIARFFNDTSPYSMRYANARYANADNVSLSMGVVRADLWSIIANDMHLRGRTTDIPVVSFDADATGLSPNYLEEIVRAFDSSQKLVIPAKLKWEMLPNLPYDCATNTLLRYWTFMDSVRDSVRTTPWYSDANTAISLRAYCEIGGYNREAAMAETIDLASRIIDASQEMPVERARKAMLTSSSRRLWKTILLGKSPFYAWDQRLLTFGHQDPLRLDWLDPVRIEHITRQNFQPWIDEFNLRFVYREGVPEPRRSMLLRQSAHIMKFTDIEREPFFEPDYIIEPIRDNQNWGKDGLEFIEKMLRGELK